MSFVFLISTPARKLASNPKATLNASGTVPYCCVTFMLVWPVGQRRWCVVVHGSSPESESRCFDYSTCVLPVTGDPTNTRKAEVGQIALSSFVKVPSQLTTA